MKTRRHPILGFFSGLLLGVGIALMLFTFGIVPMTVLWLAVLMVGGIVIGIALAYALPARGRTSGP
ncbi:MAG: hypothetical protein Q7V58_17260 [Actinomycetota bacterium]|nr:hypothetical protein [Actinomycetota bacterium]